MASSQQEELSRDVHVPSCVREECKDHLDRLVSRLTERGVRSVYQARGDYKPGGKYSDRFTQHFTECRMTIIHICTQLLRKISLVKEVILTDPEKTCFVHIPCSPEEYPDFVDEFNVCNLCDDAAFNKFIDGMVDADIRRPAAPDLPSRRPPSVHPTPQTHTGGHLNMFDVYETSPTNFKPVRMIHRGTECPVMHLHNSEFSAINSQSISWNSKDDCVQLAQWPALFDKKSPHPLFFILHVVMPDLYKQHKITHLIHLSAINQRLLHERSLRFVQLLLLTQDPAKCARHELQAAECCLYTSLLNLKTSHEASNAVTIIVTYLMTLFSYVMTCHADGQDGECDDHLAAIKRRPLFAKLPKVSGIKKQKTWIKLVYDCLCTWHKQTCQGLCSTLRSMASSAPDPKEKHAQYSQEMQLFILISGLFQLHKSCNLALFTRHWSCIELKSKASMMNTVIASLNISVLTAFLEFKAGLLTSSSNFPKVCKKVGDLLRQSFKMLRERERLQHAGQLTTLVFHINKSIRIEFFGLYYHQSANPNPNLSINFDETVCPRLLSVTQDLLFPLVTNAASTNHPEQDKEKPRCGWTVAKYCSFSEDKQVLIHLICPTFTEYIEKCRCSLRDERFNELHLLKVLQHDHIVQLQAFSETCWPQFYVTEDYSTNSLQTLLANKSRHNDHFTVKELLMFVIDALEGIKFLHDNNIVHRNLTAENFFISTDRKVKLSGLMEARKLAGETIRDFNCSFIPTRWTAPESLQNCQFSKMSDMWMVGHLIYEVLTHGRLPYADASLDDIELMPLVVVGRRTLCEEACIPGPVHSAIVQLTNIQPSTRPLEVKTISQELRLLAESITEDPMAVTFPDIREKGEAAAEHRKGPVFTVLKTFFGEDELCSMLIDETGYENVSQGIVHSAFCSMLDETGYENASQGSPHNNDGVRKGLIPFKELCPKDFSSDVWSLLTGGHLPGIAPLISQPKPNLEGKLEISLAIPAQYGLCSLKTVVERKWLGPDIKDYIECLQKIARNIAQLHSHRLLLCDFDADTIYVENISDTSLQIRVWFTSVANMRRLPCAPEKGTIGNNHIHLAPPMQKEAKLRAAPEVVKQGLYSHASDVYCFGRLMWWVFSTFCKTGVDGSGSHRALTIGPLARVPDTDIYSTISDATTLEQLEKPSACPTHIYKEIKKCWSTHCYERPAMEVLTKCLTLFESPFGTTVTELLSVINHSRRGSLSEGDDTSILDDDYDLHDSSDNLYDDIGPDDGKGARSPLTMNTPSTNPAPTSAAEAQEDSNTYEAQKDSNTYEAQKDSNTYEAQKDSNTYEAQKDSNTYEAQKDSNTYEAPEVTYATCSPQGSTRAASSPSPSALEASPPPLPPRPSNLRRPTELSRPASPRPPSYVPPPLPPRPLR